MEMTSALASPPINLTHFCRVAPPTKMDEKQLISEAWAYTRPIFGST